MCEPLRLRCSLTINTSASVVPKMDITKSTRSAQCKLEIIWPIRAELARARSVRRIVHNDMAA